MVDGATVTLSNVDTGVTQTRTTDGSGTFEFVTLRIGTYLVAAEKPGFAVALADNVRLSVGARQRVDLTLQIGQLSEQIQVSAAATLLETDTSQRAQVITGEQTRALPLNGREYSALALLTTGVRLSTLGTGTTPREGSFNVNGLRSTFNNFLIDGVDNNAYGTSNQGFSNQVMQPPPDAVAEFKVVTNNMSAEYGRAAGATVNVAYASGTNRLRGTAWEFMRDTRLNARDYFLPPSGEKPPLERNQFGSVLGGPIAQNRAFFFADYAGQFTRPAGAAANNVYNVADFMFGLRSTFALSNLLVANLRQNMHFLYLQDDFRVNQRLTLNPGVRYEYATPWVERDNILSNFDPATRQMVVAQDGSLEDRATVSPDRNNVGPRLGLAYTITPRTVLRSGYGIGYVHFHRAGGGNVLPINGPQVINAVVVQGNPLDPTFRRTEEGYATGLTASSRFNPLAANITYMPRDYHSSRVQSWLRVRAAGDCAEHDRGRRLRSEPCRRFAALRELQSGASE